MNSRSPQVREIAATPAQLRTLATREPRLFPALFDSAALGPLGRYSMLAALPGASLSLRGDGRIECRGVSLQSTDFLGALDEWWQLHRSAATSDVAEDRLPFRGLGGLPGMSRRSHQRVALARAPPDALLHGARARCTGLRSQARRCFLIEPDAAEAAARIRAWRSYGP